MKKTYHIEPVDTPCASEPVAVYQRTDPATYSHGVRPPSRTEEEMDLMAKEWLRPFTMEEINHWNEEAEEADEADDMDALVPHEVVVARMKRFINSL